MVACPVYVWKSEDNLEELISAFTTLIQALKLGSQASTASDISPPTTGLMGGSAGKGTGYQTR